jgi:hypothetical protein
VAQVIPEPSAAALLVAACLGGVATRYACRTPRTSASSVELRTPGRQGLGDGPLCRRLIPPLAPPFEGGGWMLTAPSVLRMSPAGGPCRTARCYGLRG